MLNFLNESTLSQKNGVSGCISTKDWLKFMCLSLLNVIPLIGTLAYFAIMIYLMASEQTAASVKNLIKAYCIIIVVALAISFLMFLAMSSLLIGLFQNIVPSI